MTERLILRVEESSIKSGGRVRVNEEAIENLDIYDGELIVVSSEKKDILVSMYTDDMIEEGRISIREDDRKKLDVEGRDEVEIRKHEKLLNKLL
ncbi:MAG: hypothetical protein V5A88_07275 [Candidatus Thermoplasmatota archaeon]